MAIGFRRLPQPELERIADSTTQIVDIAKNLSALRAAIADPDVATRLEAQINRLLDVGETLSDAIRSVAYASSPAS